MADAEMLLAQLSRLSRFWSLSHFQLLLDVPRLDASDARRLATLSDRVLQVGRGRCRLVTPSAIASAPVMGRSQSGWVSGAALAAGLVTTGGMARIAGSGIGVPEPFSEGEIQRLLAAGVVVIRPTARTTFLQGLGLPARQDRSPDPPATGDPLERALTAYLTEALAHHTHVPWDSGLYGRVRRDAVAAVHSFFGKQSRSFHVRCDDELNPPASRDEGLVILEVVLAPPPPTVRQVVVRVTLGDGLPIGD
jgi:hypothetical protein